MVDGVNFNPFTGKVFTTDEISKLDTDKNGTVSSSELQEGMSWLSGQEEDIDGDVQIGNDSSSAGNVTNQENSNTQNIDINAYLTQIQDEYIEKYIQQNPELSAAEKSALVVYLKEQATEYINEAVKNNMPVACLGFSKILYLDDIFPLAVFICYAIMDFCPADMD